MVPVLLDTDILSEIVKLRDVVVVRRALAYTRQVGLLTFSAFTRYEVLRGFKRRRASTQLARFHVFCDESQVLPVTDAIWNRASDLWSEARNSGRSCEDADLVIAATAIEHQLTLVTGNTDHFSWIPGLTLDDWRNS